MQENRTILLEREPHRLAVELDALRRGERLCGHGRPGRFAAALDPRHHQSGLVIEYQFARVRQFKRVAADHGTVVGDECRGRARNDNAIAGVPLDP